MKEFFFISLGTFLGAWVAFQLQLAERTKKEKRSEAAAGRRALLVLCNQYCLVKRYYELVLKQFKDDKFRWLKLQPYDAFHSFLRQDIEGLGFLLDSPDPSLIQKLLIAEESFIELVTTVHQRNEVHLNQFQIELQTVKVVPQDDEELQFMFGPRLMALLRNLTDYTFELAGSTLKLNEESFDALNLYLNAHYSDFRRLRREDVQGNSNQEQ